MDKKKETILIVITLFVFGYFIVRATYAYFQSRSDGSSNVDIKLTTYTTDLLTFETGDAINITADQETFGKDKGNRSSSTFAKAILMANNMTNVAKDNYYVYLNIESNDFTYTTTGKPELVLQVTDNSGNPVTSIDGLTYVTTVDGSGTSISGFDITKKSGLITLVNNKEISASPRIEEQYNVTLVLINYDFDQNNNAGKSFNAKLMIQKDKIKETIAMVCSNGQSLSDCIKSMNGKDDTLYYHDASLTNGAGDNSYRYAGASDQVNNYVCFGSTQSPCPTDNLYRIIGVFGDRVKLIKSDYAISALLGTDGDYKAAYSGITTKYKGSLSTSDIDGYMWNYNGLSDKSINSGWGSNTWSTSLLNKTNLNTNFITNIGAEWANKIDMTTWKVGGNTFANIATQSAKPVYQNEIVNPVTTNSTDNKTEYSAKIGLMYASDYGFAAAPSAWTNVLYNYSGEDIKNVNWMYMGIFEWTISRSDRNASCVFNVSDIGDVYDSNANNAFGVRPSFYLNSLIIYSSGSGTSSDPIRIAD